MPVAKTFFGRVRLRVGSRVSPLERPTIQSHPLKLDSKTFLASGVDLLFALPAIKEHGLLEEQVTGYLDSSDFLLPDAETEDCLSALNSIIHISHNLFQPLGRVKADGKRYNDRNQRAPEQQTFSII